MIKTKYLWTEIKYLGPKLNYSVLSFTRERWHRIKIINKNYRIKTFFAATLKGVLKHTLRLNFTYE